MINFYNYLTNKKVSQSLYEMLFSKFMQNAEPPTYTEYEGALPITITANGSNLADWLIYGNTSTSGTPTPSDPITIEGVGDLVTTGEHAGQYEILMKSNTTAVAPMYLSEPLMKIGTYYDTLDAVGMTTYNIKKLVLNGMETGWNKSTRYAGSFYNAILSTNAIASICSHAEFITDINPATYVYGKFGFDGAGSLKNLNLFIGQSDWTVDDFKAYLAQQYTNGTPVTIYYVPLAATTEAITASPIPTNNGSTVISCDNTVQPEKMYIKYIGG